MSGLFATDPSLPYLAMRFRTLLTYLSLLPLSACTKSCNDYDNNEEFARAQLPAYTETGANTLGCVLGAQKWTVLGSQNSPSPLGSGWRPNVLQVYGGSSVPPLLEVRGTMSGVRNSEVFYDREIALTFLLSDTLGGLRLLGEDTVRTRPGHYREYMEALDLIPYVGYHSSARRPVRLLIRKLDRQRRTVSGTFAGMLYGGSLSGHDSLAVTDGRFDVKY
ncbi:hypothetical protein Q5H92_17100 [Hymenobacter sp. M29]|uniref:Uncharacterized protein n=1 Tax=Hymenobacter mellowenesis TaxID=3063995 RepID=A0ABT9AE11_9BACT|nr:hypothetical protein [Hymenobacter sp. M29]MDO7848086.1 hypothetical protein [Hymenobacter sp. M29]